MSAAARPGVPDRRTGSTVLPALGACPACRGHLHGVALREEVAFFCGHCLAYWRFELGFVSRVPAPTAAPAGTREAVA